MKKFVLSIVTILYLGLSTGATIHIHYCMGKLVNIGLVNKNSSHCTKCGMVAKQQGKGCCHDEQHLVKIEKDQNINEAAYQLMQLSSIAVVPGFTELPSIFKSSITAITYCINAPPDKSQVPIYLRNCIFRI